MRKILISLFAVLLTAGFGFPALAQGPIGIVNGQTPTIGFTNGHCVGVGNNSLLTDVTCSTEANIQVGSTTISGGTNGYTLFNDSGLLGNTSHLTVDKTLGYLNVDNMLLIGQTAREIDGVFQYTNIQNSGGTTTGTRLGGNVAQFEFSNDNSAAFLAFGKSRSTTRGAHVALVSGDNMGEINYSGSDGANYIYSAYFTAGVDGAVSAGVMPSRYEFGLMDSAGRKREFMRLSGPEGSLTIGDRLEGTRNNLVLKEGLTGNYPLFQFNGIDTNVGAAFNSKGTGNFGFYSGAGSFFPQLVILGTASTVNYLTLTGGATGSPGAVDIGAAGTDSDITIRVTPKGAGIFRVTGNMLAKAVSGNTSLTLQDGSGTNTWGLAAQTDGFFTIFDSTGSKNPIRIIANAATNSLYLGLAHVGVVTKLAVGSISVPTETLAVTGTFSVTGTATVGIPRFNGTNSTGAGSAALGANSPAVTLTAPYTWITVTTSDGSTGYIPVWK